MCNPSRSTRRHYTLAQATEMCGYRRRNTFRELHLATAEERDALGHAYDEHGRVVLEAGAVEALAERVRIARLARGPWRAKNLGRYALPRGQRATRVSTLAKPNVEANSATTKPTAHIVQDAARSDADAACAQDAKRVRRMVHTKVAAAGSAEVAETAKSAHRRAR